MMRSMKGVSWVEAAECARHNQIQAMRQPPFELVTLRSSFDLDGIASDAVEGRNKQLEFYRKRENKRYWL